MTCLSTEYRALLFGVFTLQKDELTLLLPALSSARNLLAYLLLNRQLPHTRDMLVGQFWPYLSETRARRALTQALWHIHRCLPGLVEAKTETVRIHQHAPIWIDINVFEALVNPPLNSITTNSAAAEDLRQAVQLYRGDLLEGIYDDWALIERERWRELYLQTLEHLTRIEKAAGQYQSALDSALKLVRADPLREAAQREVMRLYFLLNRPEAALKQYSACCRILKEELALEPDGETVALAQEIAARLGPKGIAYLPEIPMLSSPAPLEKAQRDLIPLVGRSQQRAQLLTHVQVVFDGMGGVILLEGESGVGKTRLLQEVARDVEWRGAQVLRSRGRDQEAAFPFGLLVEALVGGVTTLRASQLIRLVEMIWLQVLAPLLPPLAIALPRLDPPAMLEPNQERSRLVEAIVHFLSGWAQITPLVIILEDVHWADRDTLDVLAPLAQRLRETRVLLLISYRLGEALSQPPVWEKLQALDRSEVLFRLRLTRLDRAATGELIRQCLGLTTLAPLFEERLYRETGGNPLFVIETLRVLHDEALLFRDESGEWHTPIDTSTTDYSELPLSAAVERVIARRLSQLSGEARQMLNAAAVLGYIFDFALVQEVSGLETKTTLSAINELLRRQLIEETAQAYHFSHDKVRQVIYNDLLGEARVRYHARTAQAIEARHPEKIEALAYHFTEGQDWGNGVEYHFQSGERARAVHANQAALEHYTTAIELLDKRHYDELRRVRLHCDLLFARYPLLWLKGDVAQQTVDLDVLCQLTEAMEDWARHAEALNNKAFLLADTSQADAAIQQALAAQQFAEAHGLPTAAATALGILGMVYKDIDQYEAAETALLQALNLWQATERNSNQAAQLHFRLAQVYVNTGRLEQARAAGEVSLSIAQDRRDPLSRSRALTALGIVAKNQGDYPAAITYNQSGLEQARAAGFRQAEAAQLSNLGLAHWMLGQYGQAIQLYRQSLAISRELNAQRTTMNTLQNLGQLFAVIGHYEEARAVQSEGLELARSIHSDYTEAMFLFNQGQTALGEKRLDEARKLFHRALEIAQRVQVADAQGSAWLGLGQASMAAENVEEAARSFEQALEVARAANQADMATSAASYLAICFLALGRLEEALRLSGEAVREIEFRQGGQDIPAIYLHHARILNAAGQAVGARAALENAYRILNLQQATLPDADWQRDFIANLPAHGEIVADYAALQARLSAGRQILRLPRSGAPTGRPLRVDEWVEVAWTLTAPEDELVADKAERRRIRLLRLLKEAAEQRGVPGVNDLAAALGVSPKTILRDLAALRREGHMVKTRGG